MAVKTPHSLVKSLPSADARGAVKALVRPDYWATQLELEVDTKKFTTNYRHYICDPIRDSEYEIVIKKAAQMGFTVGMVIKALHAVQQRKWNVMYLLPFKNNSRTFVQARVDPILDSNPKLAKLFSRVENVTHKQSSQKVNLYFRGTNIATELREAPVDMEIWDERDKFVTTYLGDALARMDASEYARLVQLSTPTGPGIGIDREENWKSSDQREWEIPCPHCGRFQVLRMDENVQLGDTPEESVLECSLCHKEINDLQRREANNYGRWVPTYLDGRKRGYHISQLNSPTKKFSSFISGWFDGQENVQALRDFHNLQLGEPYAGQGDKFTEGILDNCVVSGLQRRTMPNGPLFIGVDVGARLHVKASYLNRGKKVTWDIRVLRSFKELDDFLGSLPNFMCVIDAHPEKHKAKELAQKYKGRVYLGFEKDSPKQAEMIVFDEKKLEVHIDRTMTLDQLISDYTDRKYALPMDARDLGEEMPRKSFNGFYAHHLEMVRIKKELPGGVETYRWEKTSNADHFHHADMFELVAFQKTPRLLVPSSVATAFQRAGGLVG